MKIQSFLILAFFLSLYIASSSARRKHHRHLKRIEAANDCPAKNSGVYQKVCKQLQKYYVLTPDDKLGSYLKGGLQEAANRVLTPVSKSDKITFDIVQNCLKNFQVMVNSHNKEALRKYRECKKQCSAEVGRAFSSELDKTGVRIAECLNESL